MNYKKLYDRIIENRQQNPINEGYSENHHIVPRSLGGSDNLDNLVRLSAREHFICHYLLAKMYKKETFEWYKMNHAFMMMKCKSVCNDRYFNSRLYESLRGNFSSIMSQIQKGENNSQHGTCWICHIGDEKNKKIPKLDLELWETEGWVKGRDIWVKIQKQKQKVNLKDLERKNKVEKYSNLYELYIENGFTEFVRITGYEFSKQNLVNQFKKYVPEFKPQNGKKRGK